jgi:hypothetical protein
MPDNFSHVANSILRETLEASPRQVRTEELRQGLTMTVESLGYDVINDSMPSSVLLSRTVAAREASNHWLRLTPGIRPGRSSDRLRLVAHARGPPKSVVG